jgi:hypothetical protein
VGEEPLLRALHVTEVDEHRVDLRLHGGATDRQRTGSRRRPR